MEPQPIVATITKEFDCPLCLSLIRDPMLTSCCGQHFCAECIRKVITSNNPCPLCNDATFSVVFNKHFNRNLRNARAYCNLRQEGCDWEGTVGEFEEHHGQCEYASVTCPNNCGAVLKRKALAAHSERDCPLHRGACEHCALEGTRQFLTGPHALECPRMPVPCPNGCNVSVPRANVAAHLGECLHQVVRCPFHCVGCLDEFPRSKMVAHSQEHVSKHLDLVCYRMRTLQESFHFKMEEKDRQVAELERKANEKEKRAETLQLRLEGLEAYIGSCLPGNVPSLFATTLTGLSKFRAINEAWYSSPFYTGPAGYKMCLKAHTATETDMAVHVCILRGEFDAILRWPMTAEVTVELVSHHVSQNHHRMKRKATWSKVTGGERGSGFGWGNFISYGRLALKDSPYVLADCITLRVVCFDIVDL